MTEDQRIATLRREINDAVDRYLARIGGECIALPSNRPPDPASYDPATYWLEHWPPRPGELDPKEKRLWLTKGQAEKELGVGKTKIDELIRDYDVSVWYGGRRLLNRYRSFAALHFNLPPRTKTGVSG